MHKVRSYEAMKYGWNDADGTVHCAFCEWTKQCTRGMEEIEFELKRHLKEAHDKPLLYRIENESGRRTDIP